MKGKNALFGSQNSANRWNSNASNLSKRHGNNSYDLKNHIYPHDLPIKHIPNSKIEQRDDNGKLIRIRHYDINGNVYKDVDYTDHGTPEKHKIPHTHYIEIINGKIKRKKGAKSHGII